LDGCSIDTIWNIEVLPSPETINLDTAYNICGASFDIAWTSNATEIQWVLPSDVLLDSTTDSLLFALNTFGVHPIQVITSIGMCSATFDFTIYNDAPIDTIEAGPDQHIAYGLTASLFGLTNATEVIWTTNDALDFSSPNEQISLATASQNGTYDLYFTATNGSCVASDSLQLIFEGGQLPNTITPNGDGINDTFDVGGSTAQVIKLKIVNRWGQLVYENSNYQNDWTGTTTDGQSLPNDTYFYEINVVNQNLTGFIQIKR
jgi:gliding motility-associated-like protein